MLSPEDSASDTSSINPDDISLDSYYEKHDNRTGLRSSIKSKNQFVSLKNKVSGLLILRKQQKCNVKKSIGSNPGEDGSRIQFDSANFATRQSVDQTKAQRELHRLQSDGTKEDSPLNPSQRHFQQMKNKVSNFVSPLRKSVVSRQMTSGPHGSQSTSLNTPHCRKDLRERNKSGSTLADRNLVARAVTPSPKRVVTSPKRVISVVVRNPASINDRALNQVQDSRQNCERQESISFRQHKEAETKKPSNPLIIVNDLHQAHTPTNAHTKLRSPYVPARFSCNKMAREGSQSSRGYYDQYLDKGVADSGTNIIEKNGSFKRNSHLQRKDTHHASHHIIVGAIHPQDRNTTDSEISIAISASGTPSTSDSTCSSHSEKIIKRQVTWADETQDNEDETTTVRTEATSYRTTDSISKSYDNSTYDDSTNKSYDESTYKSYDDSSFKSGDESACKSFSDSTTDGKKDLQLFEGEDRSCYYCDDDRIFFTSENTDHDSVPFPSDTPHSTLFQEGHGHGHNELNKTTADAIKGNTGEKWSILESISCGAF
mmetsp:Transcript_62559/g.75289  ORF Transcript_62559/g.75289 Transcript_62559/m.75289 type:complete len:543 (-) Transcript_62559:72-1700(-)